MDSTFIGCRVAVGVGVTVGVLIAAATAVGEAVMLGVIDGAMVAGSVASVGGSAGRDSTLAVQPAASAISISDSVINQKSFGNRIIFIFYEYP
jgi:hypothetical protein